MGRDHSIQCERCGAWYSGFNGPDECECGPSVFPCSICGGRVKPWCQPESANRAGAHYSCIEWIRLTLNCLASNLRIAAGLCEAFRSGKDYWIAWDSPYVCDEELHAMCWHPGCRKPAPGWGEQ